MSSLEQLADKKIHFVGIGGAGMSGRRQTLCANPAVRSAARGRNVPLLRGVVHEGGGIPVRPLCARHPLSWLRTLRTGRCRGPDHSLERRAGRRSLEARAGPCGRMFGDSEAR